MKLAELIASRGFEQVSKFGLYALINEATSLRQVVRVDLLRRDHREISKHDAREIIFYAKEPGHVPTNFAIVSAYPGGQLLFEII